MQVVMRMEDKDAETIVRNLYKTLGNALGQSVANKMLGDVATISKPQEALKNVMKKLAEVFGETTMKNMVYVVITMSFEDKVAKNLAQELEVYMDRGVGES